MQLATEPIARVVNVAEAHVAATASLLATAFADDAAYAYLFPDAGSRVAGLADFFARNLRTHLAHGCTFVAIDAIGRPLATVTLRPPSGLHISLWTMLRRGLLPFAAAHGLDAVRRLLWLKRAYDAFEAEAAENMPHAYVHMMGVAPEHQGRGLGSRLLAHVLGARAAAQTVLTTNLPRNVVFYRRHGFEVTSERVLQPPGSHAYTAWSMRAEPLR